MAKMKTVKVQTAADISFIQGFGMAVAEIVRMHDQPTIAADMIAGSGFDLTDFRLCDPYDLNVIRKLFREENVLWNRVEIREVPRRGK